MEILLSIIKKKANKERSTALFIGGIHITTLSVAEVKKLKKVTKITFLVETGLGNVYSVT